MQVFKNLFLNAAAGGRKTSPQRGLALQTTRKAGSPTKTKKGFWPDKLTFSKVFWSGETDFREWFVAKQLRTSFRTPFSTKQLRVAWC